MASLLLLTWPDWSGVYTLHATALKRIPRSKLASQQQQDRVATERQILETVASPFLCRSHAAFETEEEVAFLLEYIEGRALYECIWKYKDSGKFPESVARFFAAHIVLALRHLHARGYIHRDLKSGNILVNQSGFAKVIDFGLSKKVLAVHQAGLEESEGAEEISDRTQSMCGTHYVMAPEVFFREPYGFAIDWWYVAMSCPLWR
ncbi:hypothetical protein BBJ28_00011023 [Nothophytophthora sp. Chile5]|nr:hypothetical protein BBJ28_00011023 [Nothophytophthora sp. Chile5]